jgi:membrane dipeptidase
VYRIFDGLNGSRITRDYVAQALAHGVEVVHVTVNNFTFVRPYPTLKESLNELAAIRAHYDTLSDVTRIVHSTQDFDAARKDGKLAVVFGYQNVPPIEADLRILQLFHDLGVRCIQIAHNNAGPYAGGCADKPDAGLTPLGRELIAELNRLRIVIDVSHTGLCDPCQRLRDLSECPQQVGCLPRCVEGEGRGDRPVLSDAARAHGRREANARRPCRTFYPCP